MKSKYTFNKWVRQVQHILFARVGDRVFTMTAANLSRGRWVVLALESAFGGVQAVLDDHAHEEVGEAKNFKDAKALAEKWLKKAKRHTRAKCECKPITPPPEPPAEFGDEIDAEFDA